jgi:hypothetical protein
MPIRAYLGRGVVFTPNALSAMSQALESATKILEIEGDERQREIVAKFLIRVAGEDDSLDATALLDQVLAALGGVAYSATIPASPQPSNPQAAAE